MYKINYKNTTIRYSIEKKHKKKHISLYVKFPDIVQVVAPVASNDDIIHNFVNSKAKWILNKLNDFQTRGNSIDKISIKNGNKISYFGVDYEIFIIDKKNTTDYSLSVYDNKFIFDIPTNKANNIDDILSQLLISYFIKQGTLDVSKRINIYAKRLNVKPNAIRVNNKKTSWGSCSSLGNININYKLLLAPLDIIDYVLVHELCHLIEMNHSKSFWNLVENVIPDYNSKKNWLKTYGFSLNL